MPDQTKNSGAAQAVQPTKTSSVLSESAYSIAVHVGAQTQVLNYRSAFALAHDLLNRSKFALASSILERLCRVNASEPCAYILLAICEARLSRYSIAFMVLNKAAFADEMLAAEIYDAILQTRMGFKEDALQKVLRLENEHKDLPALSLWLGDMYDSIGHQQTALECWLRAIGHDSSIGAVALAAKSQITRLTKHVAALAPDMAQPTA